MTGDSEVWGSWMTGLGVLAVILIFGAAYYWVNAIRRGNRGVRARQQSHTDDTPPSPEQRKYPEPETRDDLR